jgi:hypothetical protein
MTAWCRCRAGALRMGSVLNHGYQKGNGLIDFGLCNGEKSRLSALMSAYGPKRTWAIALHMSAFGARVDIALHRKMFSFTAMQARLIAPLRASWRQSSSCPLTKTLAATPCEYCPKR